jgi:hypothetical protein
MARGLEVFYFQLTSGLFPTRFGDVANWPRTSVPPCFGVASSSLRMFSDSLRGIFQPAAGAFQLTSGLSFQPTSGAASNWLRELWVSTGGFPTGFGF